jgi:hypothetical protein
MQKTKIPRPVSEATVSNRYSVSTFTLPLPEGQIGGTWEPYNNMMLLPLKKKSSRISHDFPFSPGLLPLFITFQPVLRLQKSQCGSNQRKSLLSF